MGETCVAPGWTTHTVPSRSAISIRPSGVKVIAVGSSSPMITRSLTNCGAGVPAIVTVTGDDVVRLPAASRAIAVSVWLPAVAPLVFQAVLYGALVSSAPRFAPSSWNWTPATPWLSVALAVTVTVPLTRARGRGRDLRGRRRGVAAGGRHGRVHVGLELGGGQRAVVDPHLVDQAAEVLAPDRVAADLQLRRS